MIDGLEAEVRHAERIGVRIYETDPYLSAGVFADGPFFPRKDIFCVLFKFPGNGANPPIPSIKYL